MAYAVTSAFAVDGTGPELIENAQRVVEATGVKFEWDVVEQA